MFRLVLTVDYTNAYIPIFIDLTVTKQEILDKTSQIKHLRQFLEAYLLGECCCACCSPIGKFGFILVGVPVLLRNCPLPIGRWGNVKFPAGIRKEHKKLQTQTGQCLLIKTCLRKSRQRENIICSLLREVRTLITQ